MQERGPHRSQACDACAARKRRCDRRNPCRRCNILGIDCRTSRTRSKPGPKGPWAWKRRVLSGTREGIPIQPQSDASNTKSDPTIDTLDYDCLTYYIDVYSDLLYPVWPVVDRDEMISRLGDSDDLEAMALTTALSAVVLTHLRLRPDRCSRPDELDALRMASRSEHYRLLLHYQEKPTIERLLSSFFLHIFWANRGQICKSTILLREANTFAQFLELDKLKHYTLLSEVDKQLHLRIVWILCITERGHTTRFSLPRILYLNPDLPPLNIKEVPSALVAFTELCQLFKTFASAMDSPSSKRTADFFSSMDLRLREMRQLQTKRELQEADFLISQQWMRIMLWKLSMYHIQLSTNAEDENLSVSFPERVARNIIVHLSRFSHSVVEAHGLGMQMKLADVAISLADVVSCIPWISERHEVMRVGPTDMLNHLTTFLVSLRGNVNPKLQVLLEKLSDMGWGFTPGYSIRECHAASRVQLLSVEQSEDLENPGSASSDLFEDAW